MRRTLFAAALAVGVGTPLASTRFEALAAPDGFYEAKRAFSDNFDERARQIAQVWLIAGGFQNAVPTTQLSTRTFEALQTFEAQNDFAPNGVLDKAQIDRLFAIGNPLFDSWGLRRVTLPGHEAAIWAPFGLDLEVRRTDKGFAYADHLDRFSVLFQSLPNVSAKDSLDYLLEKAARDGTTVHYKILKDGWFALSTTTVDGRDHYRRYHEDGTALTGFAMDWNNAAGDVHAERIAVLDSAVLAASMTGESFIDPPHRAPAVAAAPPEPPTVRAAGVPIAPQPQPEPQAPQGRISTGSGFFVTNAGHLVTNAHVVNGCSEVLVKTDDNAVSPAVELATDTTNDLALLKITKTPARVAALRMGLRVGEGVEAFGFPHVDVLSTSGNFTLGNVTALAGLRDDGRFVQISAPVQAGNSGGPLLDGYGNLVGVVTAKWNAVKVMLASDDLPQNVNFAVKSGMVAQFLDANRIAYRTGAPGDQALNPADLADRARQMSAFVMCR